jgi:hypothetical protein
MLGEGVGGQFDAQVIGHGVAVTRREAVSMTVARQSQPPPVGI